MRMKQEVENIIENALDQKLRKADLMTVGKALHEAGVWPAPKMNDPYIKNFVEMMGFRVSGRTVYK